MQSYFFIDSDKSRKKLFIFLTVINNICYQLAVFLEAIIKH